MILLCVRWGDKRLKNNDIEIMIFELEKKLLYEDIRKSAEELEKLLEYNFVEFCSSGKIYKYKKGDIFDIDCNPLGEIIDFKLKILTDEVVLATYKFIRYGQKYIKNKYTLRSSIWKYTDGKWKIVFHQGTIINEEIWGVNKMSKIDLEAAKKWRKIPKDMQKKLINNVFCGKWGVTTIVDYSINDDMYGVLLKGYCKKCGGKVARLVENE